VGGRRKPAAHSLRGLYPPSGAEVDPYPRRGASIGEEMLDSLLLSDPVSNRVPVLLVADDDEDILTLVQLRLSRSGFEVIVARDGEEALRMAQERHPDLAVLDWMMPKASGLEVLRAIRANPETADIPVVLLTARASEADVQEGLDAGAVDYIAKPFSPQELAARVQTILGA
jgi:DNA-binding response OmpR family regulator